MLHNEKNNLAHLDLFTTTAYTFPRGVAWVPSKEVRRNFHVTATN